MESKIELTRRLKETGLWDEASTFMDEVRRQARSERKTRREASEAAWLAAVAKYPRPESLADQGGAAGPGDADGVSRHVCEAAGNEVRRWQGEFGVELSEEAFAALAGGVTGYFWALGLMHELPGGTPEVAA
jgi:hypothetical protein